jgi:hypothetical protein
MDGMKVRGNRGGWEVDVHAHEKGGKRSDLGIGKIFIIVHLNILCTSMRITGAKLETLLMKRGYDQTTTTSNDKD